MSKLCDGDGPNCTKELGSSYYQDVPGQGNLCLPCHTRWFREQEEIVREHRYKIPKLTDELREFIVTKEEIHYIDVCVMATSREEALKIVYEGGGEIGDGELGGEVNHDAWKVHDTAMDYKEGEDEP